MINPVSLALEINANVSIRMKSRRPIPASQSLKRRATFAGPDCGSLRRKFRHGRPKLGPPKERVVAISDRSKNKGSRPGSDPVLEPVSFDDWLGAS